MKTIKLLPKNLIAKIAAGQVVERPASVVKELIENALDAGATEISIDLVEAGLSEIVVTDNGHGMSRDDLEACYLPHATSKIATVDDLLNIHSFGFRGEALASIAAVSTITIASKQTSAVGGWQVTVDKGVVQEVEPVGMPDGTKVTVERLFATVPARKKFMKSKNTELRHCLDVVTALALIYRDVSFVVNHNGVELMRTTSYDSQLDALSSLVSEVFAHGALPIDFSQDVVHVSGFLGKPDASRSTERHQYVSINQRPVLNPELKKAVKKGYGTLLEPRSYPQFVLHIDYPIESLDVNVDPRKEVVRFDTEIHDVLAHAVKEALQEHDVSYSTSSALRDMDDVLGERMKTKTKPWSVKQLNESEIAQLHNVYLVVESEDGLLLVDQHAAHERILFEQLYASYNEEREESKKSILDTSVIIKLSAADAHIMDEYHDTFTNLGFDMEAFGKNEYKVDAIPTVFEGRDVQAVVHDMLDEVTSPEEVEYDNMTHRTITYIACRSAIMAGDALTQNERRQLVKKLFECEKPYTCPHGRPTFIKMTQKELDRMFKRR